MTTVFFDVDTQLDFMAPAGALYVRGAEHIVDTVARLNRYAASKAIPLISTMDAHPEDDVEFKLYHPHCVAGTWGQKKPAATLVEGQRIFEKVTVNVFDSPRVGELLFGDYYVVYGVVAEICVKHAALGLLKAGKKVELVEDAVKQLDDPNRDEFLELFRTSGGTFTTASAVCV